MPAPKKKKAPSKRLQTISNQLQAAALIVSGLPHREVASRVGVAERTMRHWYSQDSFQAMVSDARVEVHARTFDAVGALAEESIAGLRSAICAAVAKIHSEGFDGHTADFLLRAANSVLLSRMLPTATEPTEEASRIVIQIPDNGRQPSRLVDATPLPRSA